MNEISKPSKGAEKILLAQIKQEFSAPAEAIEHYVDLVEQYANENNFCLLYTSPSPRDSSKSRMPSSA